MAIAVRPSLSMFSAHGKRLGTSVGRMLPKINAKFGHKPRHEREKLSWGQPDRWKCASRAVVQLHCYRTILLPCG